MGGKKARALLIERLAREKDRDVLMAINGALSLRFAGDPAVEKAIGEAAARLPKEQPWPEPAPEPGPRPAPGEVF